jgi:hypothetical protein
MLPFSRIVYAFVRGSRPKMGEDVPQITRIARNSEISAGA